MRTQRVLGLGLLVTLFLEAAVSASPLIDAAKRRDPAAVGRLLDQGEAASAREADGTTALHWAAYWQDADLVERLLRAGAPLNAATDLGVTPLALAAGGDTGALVARLLAAGADADLQSVARVTPLMIAARHGNVDAVRSLLEYGATVDVQEGTKEQTALMWAISERHTAVVRLLIDYGADVSLRSRTTTQMVLLQPAVNEDGIRSVKTARQIGVEFPKGGGSALLFAAWAGDLESAKLLVDAGADVNDAAADGSTALISAIHAGHSAVAALLLDRGADPNRFTNYSALHVAALRADRLLVRALLAHGANPNAQVVRGMPVRRFGLEWVIPGTHIGATPLVIAANYLDHEIMRDLLAGGANPNLAMRDGTTAAMVVTEVIERLGRPPLSSAEAVCLNSAGFTIPCSGPEATNRVDGGRESAPPNPEREVAGALRLLVDAGADLNAINGRGDSVLHGAASLGMPTVLELLADRGADLNVKNTRGKTPLRLAIDASVRDGGKASSVQAADVLRARGARE